MTVGKILKLSLVVLLLIFSAGCQGYREVDETAFVIALGLDKGRENVLTVTFQIAVPRAIAAGGGGNGSGGGGEEPSLVVSVESPTLLGALESANAFVDRRVSLSHTRAIVFSRDLAEEGVQRYLAPLTRFREFRRNTFVMVSEGSARDLLKEIKPVLESNPSKFLELLAGGERYTEFILNSTFYNFYNPLKLPAQSPLAALAGLQREQPGPPDPSYKTKAGYTAGSIPREGGGGPELMGAAVFSMGKMVGSINGDEVGLVKMIQGELGRTIMNLPDPLHPDRFVIIELSPRKQPEVTSLLLEDGSVSVDVMVPLEGSIISIQSGENYESPRLMPIVEEALEERFSSQTAELIRKAQTEFGTDFFGFGHEVKKQFLTWPEWYEFNWPERFPDADITVSYELRIRRTGLLHETRPIQ